MSAIQNSINVTVITGFLGSGKTTLLSRLLKNAEMVNTAVIINEFGEVGLDHALIERTDENIVEMQNGCICCTIRGDLQKTLLDLADKMLSKKIRYFDRVVIETTGLADPVPIIHTLMSSFDLNRLYTLDGVITVVDAVNGENTLDTHQEALKQAAMAERIILSKTDLADKQKQQMLINRLKSINPTADIVLGVNGDVAVADFLELGAYDPYNKSQDVKKWLAEESLQNSHNHHHSHHHHDVNRHGDNIPSFALTLDKPVSFDAFNFFLVILSGQVGADLLRVKGILNVAGESRPAVIHGVQHIFHPVKWLDSWPDNDKRTRVVFITKDIKKEQVEGFFNALMGLVEENKKQEEVAFA